MHEDVSAFLVATTEVIGRTQLWQSLASFCAACAPTTGGTGDAGNAGVRDGAADITIMADPDAP